MGIDWYQVAAELKYSAKQSMQESIQEKVNVYVQEERNNGIMLMTRALYEAKVKDDEIIRLLQKYYDLTLADAENCLNFIKTVQSPIDKMYEYLMREEGFTSEEASNYIWGHNMEQQLKINKSLWKKNTR